jgi:hypothetical protein
MDGWIYKIKGVWKGLGNQMVREGWVAAVQRNAE